MQILEKFIPETYKQLTTEERKDAIVQLTNDICHELNLKPIHVIFAKYAKDDRGSLLGKCHYHPLCISINNLFVNSTDKIKKISRITKDYDSMSVYYLVYTLAHECYHYYQSNLIHKLVNKEPLTEEEKISAYVFLVCYYNNAFASYNERLNIQPKPPLQKKDLYIYSPIELGANAFAMNFTENLGKMDSRKNLINFTNIHINDALSLILNYHKLNKTNLIEESLRYDYETALAFFNHKNDASGIPTPYLNIDIEELKLYINKALKRCKQIDKQKSSFYSKIFKK